MTFANDEVLKFYKSMPFNLASDQIENQKNIKSGVSLRNHPPLIEVLSKSSTVLEVGCGVGWLSMQMADLFDVKVTSIDFNPVVIDKAKETSRQLGIAVSFQEADLFLFKPEERFEVCISLGALHHTNNCHFAIRRCLEDFLVDKGYFYVGLYHLHGRKPFLEHFQELTEQGFSENQLLGEYSRLTNFKIDGHHTYSWFRDQVLHPHETQHTLKEITEVCAKSGARLVKTSINQFEDFETEAELFEREVEYEQVSRRWLAEGKYFPGFFTALYRKT